MCRAMWDVEHFNRCFERLTNISKSQNPMQINRILIRYWPVKIHQPPNTIGILTKVLRTSGPNLSIRAWMSDELRCKQAQNEVKSDFRVKFDVEGQCQSPPRQQKSYPRCFAPRVPIWWSWLEWVTCYRAEKQRVDARTQRHTGRCRQRQWPKLVLGKSCCTKLYDWIYHEIFSQYCWSHSPETHVTPWNIGNFTFEIRV